MGKASMCIQMLELLNTGRIYKKSELAELLNTNPRNLIEYKKELEEAGYEIESIPGNYGGYRLLKSNIIPAIYLNCIEKSVVVEAYNYVLSKNDFVKKKIFEKAIGKIATSIHLDITPPRNILAGNNYRLLMNDSEIEERYIFIEQTIKNKQVIKIEYESIKNGLKTHTLNPYDLVLYNNTWFFLAWDVEACDVWSFKLNRIKKFELLDEKFVVWKSYKLENYFNANGFKNNEEPIHVVLQAKGTHKYLFREREYGKNQTVKPLNDEYDIVEFDSQNTDQLLSFIISCLDDIRIISPDSLIEKMKRMLNTVLKQY